MTVAIPKAQDSLGEHEDDAAALQRIADDQGERPGEAVRSLIRSASAKAA
ncbi:MAG TPA: hypothetical protein VIG42_08510 [Solirubrobacteraceae bacterium]|jgi:hypothetical protein